MGAFLKFHYMLENLNIRQSAGNLQITPILVGSPETRRETPLYGL